MNVADFFAPLVDCTDTLDFVRNDMILGRDSRYFDWTASGLESRAILRRMEEILPFYANTHSHTSKNADFISNLYTQAKSRLKNLLDLGEDFLIIPSGFGATGAMKRYQEINGLYIPPRLKANLGQNLAKILGKLPLMIIGAYEHHSNEISLRNAACECVSIPLKNGILDLESLENILKNTKNSTPHKLQREIFASINIASNVSGILTPREDLAKILRSYGVNIAFDCAAISPHANTDCKLFNAAFFSPHKLLGGIGSCGILAIHKNELRFSEPPTFAAGGSVKYASKNSVLYVDDMETREDYGTPPILGLLKAALAYQYRNEVGLSFITRRENALRELFLSELRKIQGIEIYGDNVECEKLPIVSFNVSGFSPYDLAYELSYNYGIETRSGCSCAGPYGHYLMDIDELDSANLDKKPAWLRVSLHYSHNFSDIEYFIDSLKKILRQG